MKIFCGKWCWLIVKTRDKINKKCLRRNKFLKWWIISKSFILIILWSYTNVVISPKDKIKSSLTFILLHPLLNLTIFIRNSSIFQQIKTKDKKHNKIKKISYDSFYMIFYFSIFNFFHFNTFFSNKNVLTHILTQYD